ncbi:tail fiber domain-containing protein [Staphylococcus gallinarum]|uniref:tail fiber domain-containing protein n=1 Tax=Staphylococcus gallinarum TaxID=1293 RepID=UPI0030BD09F8
MGYFTNTYTLKLDLKQQNPNPVIRIVQFDSAYLNIELYDNGRKVDLQDGERFTVSVEHEATGEKNSGLAKYDGNQFVVYEMRKADMNHTGTYKARFSSYKDRNRISSLVFRYEVYEDYEEAGDPNELTLLQELFNEVEEIGHVTQRQGDYAEDRGDYANSAGDYANTAGDSQLMNWLPYVKTLEERSQRYPNPNNGDTVYVINENKVFRYDGIDSLDWEAISGYDTSVIQDIYNTKEDKTVVNELRDELRELSIGARNLLGGTYFNSPIQFKEDTAEFKITHNSTTKDLTISPTSTHTSTSTFKLELEKELTEDSFITVSFKAMVPNKTTMKIKAGNSVWSSPLNLPETTEFKNFNLTVRTTDLTSDKTDILFQLNSPISIKKESLKIEEGNRATTWTPSFLDVENRIKGLENEMNTNVVKKLIYSTDKQNTDKRLNETDDKFDQQEVRFSKIEQSADNIKQTVSKKVGATEVKSMINQTAEKIKIKASNIDFDGAVVFKTKSNKLDPNAYVKIQKGILEAKGYYHRVWRDGKSRNRTQVIQMVDGMVRVSDPKGELIDSGMYGHDYTTGINKDGKKVTNYSRSLYYTSDGISTYRDGSGKSFNPTGKVMSSGTIEFFSHEYSKARGITLYSAGGAIGLQANSNAIHIDAAATLYNRSKKSNVILRPQESLRKGINDFKFSVTSYNNGRLIFGDTAKKLGVGFRFSKSAKQKVITGIDASGKASSDVRLEIGEVRSDKILSRNGKHKAYFSGTGSGNLTQSSALRAGGIATNATNFYVGVSGELRITNKRGYNFANGIGYMPVRASKFNSVSSRKYKTNIANLDVDSLNIVKSTDIKQYNLKSDLADGVNKLKYGVILEDSHSALHEGDAIDVYTMTSILWDAVKKQQDLIEELQSNKSQ